jgi:hypothetical protein
MTLPKLSTSLRCPERSTGTETCSLVVKFGGAVRVIMPTWPAGASDSEALRSMPVSKSPLRPPVAAGHSSIKAPALRACWSR